MLAGVRVHVYLVMVVILCPSIRVISNAGEDVRNSLLVCIGYIMR